MTRFRFGLLALGALLAVGSWVALSSHAAYAQASTRMAVTLNEFSIITERPDVPAGEPDDRLLALDEALTRLAVEDPVAVRVVELRHFAGAGHEAVAHALGITVYAARQKWTYARAWLRDALTEII